MKKRMKKCADNLMTRQRCCIVSSSGRNLVILIALSSTLFDKKNSALLYLYSFMFLFILSLLYYHCLYKQDINCYFIIKATLITISLWLVWNNNHENMQQPPSPSISSSCYFATPSLSRHRDVTLVIALVLLHFFFIAS